MKNREVFKKHQAQTFAYPSAIEITSAKGNYLIDSNGLKYLDFVAGVSVNTLGHCNKFLNESVKKQIDSYSHVMVYGEFVQEPQTKLAKLLSENLPKSLSCTYFVNSGTEAIEGALKLAKRYTGKSKIISFKKSYHGSTAGSLSIMGYEIQKSNYRPLIPNCISINFNSTKRLDEIDNQTAAVVVEPYQAASGFIKANKAFLMKIREKCNKHGALLIYDEIQTCYGRTGKLFAFQHYNIIPDILCIAKGMGSGYPIGAFISSYEIMHELTHNPTLGHITTFGGNPISCTASFETLKYVLKNDLSSKCLDKENIFRFILQHELIKEIRGKGLMLAVEFNNNELATYVVKESLKRGLILFYFLLTKTAIRISPPLTITKSEIEKGCNIIIELLNSYKN
ncbi:MAG: aspartate aminotransferase family protein [Flavobacteriales bacterium]|nr:aspartate aminotransferase family protein [Flavobacteriales bacterium]|tara:strand:- start:232 stop:1419 length:1188 start_codon:yes stop_codon:yes gene_type:complete